ncbi:MAG: NADH-quinone oxidoreductase subunit C [Gallionellaceae bacterium]|nr:MAG: NADH-quinone oxidoreductase subunit C [Gallionellaceae bacterium]
MADDLNMLSERLKEVFADQMVSLENRLGELTMVVGAADMRSVFARLRDDAKFGFEQLIDLCGIDYSTYGSEVSDGGVYLSADDAGSNPFKQRFAVVYHLLSVANNARLRVKVFAGDDAMPVLDSVVEVWSSANWFEREAFDLYGIVFLGHTDLRRILTDYGFVGNPFRKDFPLSGHVEMHYDAEQRRVVYSPVTVEPREVTPRSIREENYSRH